MNKLLKNLLKPFVWLIPSGDLRRNRQLNQARTFMILIAVTLLVGFEIFIFFKLGYKYGIFVKGPDSKKHTVCIVDINKPITPEYTRKVINRMEIIHNNPKVYEYVLVEFNSPGGNPSASEELAAYLDAFQKDINTSFYIASSATSGAYMIASVSDSTLFSAPSAAVGSIGVYVDVWSAESLLQRNGIKNFSSEFASHPNKVPFGLAKDPDKDSINYMKEHVVMPIYQNFYNHVKQQRDLNDSVLSQYAEGKIFIASETVGVLVDELTTQYELRQKIIRKFGGDRTKVEFLTVDPSKVKPNIFSNFDIDLNVNFPFTENQIH